METIAAIATALGGPVAVIRISGPAALSAAESAWRGRAPLGSLAPRALHVGTVLAGDGKPLDQALAVRFPAPDSYTGEPMVEIHCHGGVLGARTVLGRVLECGARPAEPGEFTRRAFLNGKLDLTQAEAVADAVQAHTEMALRVASRQLLGALARPLTQLSETARTVLTEVEARLDFPEEGLDWLPLARLEELVAEALSGLRQLLARRREGEVLRQGVRVVIAGPPNVGKSSLLNAILGWDRAIVSHIPGTTRDTLEELAHIRGIPVRLVDTAGIRPSEDLVEGMGIRRSLDSVREAQVVLWTFDASRPYDAQACPDFVAAGALVLVGNKRDLLQEATAGGLPAGLPAPVRTCALTGDGLEELFDAVERCVWGQPHPEQPEVAVSARHAFLLDSACNFLERAHDRLQEESWELAAESLRLATRELDRVTGKAVAPDILDSIFSRFCIGK